MLQADSSIRSRLAVARLPSMPQILLKLLEQCQAEDVGMGELADLIAKDPGIAAKVLTVANSSAYHRGGQRIGLEASLTALGSDMIKTLVINESVFQVFNNFAHSNSTDLRAFWKHSLSAAVIAQEIALRSEYPNVEEAYLAGLLHDVGRLGLLAAANKEYAFLFFAPDDEKLCMIEQSVVETTHCEVGAWLVDRWQLDSFLADGVLYHHEAAARVEAAHPLVRIVFLAHVLTLATDKETMAKTAELLFEIPAAEIETIHRESHAKVRKLADFLGIDLTGADDLTVPAAGWEIAGRIAAMDEANEGSEAEPGSASALPAAAAEMATPLPAAQDKAQKLLGDELRNVVLSSEVGRSLSRQSEGEGELLLTVARSARILFEFNEVAILRVNAQATALVGVPLGENTQRLKEFSVRLEGEGIIASAAAARTVAFSVAGESLGIAEDQMLRALYSEALVCIPLCSGRRCLGVLVGGIKAWQMPAMQARSRFLKSFGDQAASYLDALARRAQEAGEATDASRAASRRVVHEANNALAIVQNYLGVIDGKLEKGDFAVSERAILHEEIGRVGHIVSGLTKPPEAAAGVADVNLIVRDVVRLFRDSRASKVELVAQTQEDGAKVRCDANSLKQILVNLVKNATEAMPKGGEIRLINNGRVNRDGILYTELCVRDNGPGIPPAVLETLFVQNRSTKGEGRGLGLAIVHELVKASQGLISCRSSDKGTAFEILLPVDKRP